MELEKYRFGWLRGNWREFVRFRRWWMAYDGDFGGCWR
jgi:hypothetical protein